MKRSNRQRENMCKGRLKTAQKNYTKIKSKKNYNLKALRRDIGPRN